MNCKQGDLAVIVCVITPLCNPNLGRFVEVLTPRVIDGIPGWKVRMIGRPGVNNAGHERWEGGIRDIFLRPIRDPGPNAVDEIVRSIGAAPKTLTEVREPGFAS
jgi:hypothetical protein